MTSGEMKSCYIWWSTDSWLPFSEYPQLMFSFAARPLCSNVKSWYDFYLTWDCCLQRVSMGETSLFSSMVCSSIAAVRDLFFTLSSLCLTGTRLLNLREGTVEFTNAFNNAKTVTTPNKVCHRNQKTQRTGISQMQI